MDVLSRSISTRPLLSVGLELLPWVGLAVGVTLLPTSTLEGLALSPRIALPVLLLVGGAAAVFGRRKLSETSSPSSQETPKHIESGHAPFAPDFHSTNSSNAPRLNGSEVRPSEADESSLPVMISRPDCTIVAVNEDFEHKFGYAEGEVLGKTPSEIGIWGNGDTESMVRKQLTLGKAVQNEEVSLRSANGTAHRALLSIDPASGEADDRLVWTLPGTAPRQNGKRPHRVLSRDSLTGLADRTALLEETTRVLEDTKDETEGPALLSITIEEYRGATESFGHDAGQQLIAAAASRIENAIPPRATAARIAEDTFAILLSETNEDQAREVGQTLLQELEVPFEIAGRQVPIQSSIGLALRPDDDTLFSSAEKMLQASYSAMYQVRREDGTNLNVVRGASQDDSRWLHRRERLREAIHQDELTLHYQPIVHLISEEMVGAEALVRWDHPERGLLPPSAFLPLAEETGLVGQIDRWVFERALQQASEWTRSPDGPVDWVSVNISPQSIEDDLQSWSRDKLRDVSLPDGALQLEITERWAIRDERSLRSLRDEGVRLAIDDYGTGYSSLRYLRSLDADVLKIDQEFIEDLGQDQKTTAIVQFLLNLSLRLDVEVIAEGVETAEQAETLQDLGCAMAQGYHFEKPIPAETLVERAYSTNWPTPHSDEALEPAYS